MKRKTIVRCILSVLLTAYLAVAVSMSRTASDTAPLAGVDIVVMDSLNSGFVSVDDIDAAAGGLRAILDTMPRAHVSTLDIEHRLRRLQTIEWASCVILNNGVLRVRVRPMVPVARVFPDGAPSYYVNAQGKRIPATSKSFIDVPVISGHITPRTDIRAMLPMLARIKADPKLDAWAGAVTVSPRGDIVIIPSVLGHVVVIGDTADMASKFDRIQRFYHEVVPLKGWQYYDTLSVKWRGRLVATRHHKKQTHNVPLTQLEGVIDETLPDESMYSTVSADKSPDKAPADKPGGTKPDKQPEKTKNT